MRNQARGSHPCQQDLSASEPKGNNFTGAKDFYMQAKAMIWPRLSYVGQIRSTAVFFGRKREANVCLHRMRWFLMSEVPL
jgi:hypothetical protein